MFRIDADDSHHALAMDHLAFVANFLDGCPYLHKCLSIPYGRVKTHGPLLVTATQCSKCAEFDPSFVTAVQRSFKTNASGPPAFTIGSTASTMPSFNRGFSFFRSI